MPKTKALVAEADLYAAHTGSPKLFSLQTGALGKGTPLTPARDGTGGLALLAEGCFPKIKRKHLCQAKPQLRTHEFDHFGYLNKSLQRNLLARLGCNSVGRNRLILCWMGLTTLTATTVFTPFSPVREASACPDGLVKSATRRADLNVSLLHIL